MRDDARLFISLQVSDLKRYPVWENILDYDAEEVSVFPIKELPVSDLTGRIAGTPVRLANGQSVWAIISHLQANDRRRNEQFVTLRVEKNGDWFDLARYWDPDYADSGPEALSRFLGLPIDDVFPIVYDLTDYAEGKRTALVGAVLKEPRERLSDDEIARLAVLK